ncbi:hypothetical protein [Ktedonobacter racemifer]|uniref:Uncharacterized protein n=1 Tax=Ktedonobacter racemifer DSM 44963 TaxID=485913 RepID=D6U8Q8_KTERA|nr:hypothetical protein [Ktedonobacter racemifer]EFH79618.1 hypothetical protein Krac_0096 [Ktedonobacter racemifer DSM 44963]
MAHFHYKYMRKIIDEQGTPVYVSPNNYLDITTSEAVNCPGKSQRQPCEAVATVQDVQPYEHALEYQYQCPSCGHKFHILYHK